MGDGCNSCCSTVAPGKGSTRACQQEQWLAERSADQTEEWAKAIDFDFGVLPHEYLNFTKAKSPQHRHPVISDMDYLDNALELRELPRPFLHAVNRPTLQPTQSQQRIQVLNIRPTRKIQACPQVQLSSSSPMAEPSLARTSTSGTRGGKMLASRVTVRDRSSNKVSII